MAAEPAPEVLALGFRVEELRGPASYAARILPSLPQLRGQFPPDANLALAWGSGGAAVLVAGPTGIAVQPVDSSPAGEGPVREAPGDALAGSRQQVAGGLTVYLAEPRRDYRHNALGSPEEAGAVVIRERGVAPPGSGARPVPIQVSRIVAGEDAVFEDREPRLADLDRDGTPEILTVKTYRDRGAALAVIARREGTWRIVAETPPIGDAKRWLNPAAVADFDGDGRTEIALVVTPHTMGRLQVWSFADDRLTLRHEAEGHSNHALGSSALDLATPVEGDDGVPHLAIPSLDRASVSILSLKTGIRELRRIPLPGRVETGLVALGQGPAQRLITGLDDGRLLVIDP